MHTLALALLCLALVLLCAVLARHVVVRRRRRNLRGAHVWLLGASQGLGRALAHALASSGCTVSLSARRAPHLETLRSELGTSCGSVVPLDVCSRIETLSAALESVETRSGQPVDIVLCNAGVNNGNQPLATLQPDTLDTVLDTNLRAPMRLARVSYSRLRARRGAFVVISSLAAYRGLPGAAPYCASKAGVTALCQSLAVEWAREGVDVVCVHPGFVDTPAIRHLSHPKPLLMSEMAAARAVVAAVRDRARHAAFPWVMEHVVMRISRMLPTPVYNFVMARVG